MSAITANYYDGKHSVRKPVALRFSLSAGRLAVAGDELAAEYDLSAVRFAPRIANTPRWIYLPDGATCAVPDNDAIDRIAPESRILRIVRAWERQPVYAVVSALLVAGLVWLFVDRGVPPIARSIAERIPASSEASLGERTLEEMSGGDFMAPSDLAAERRDRLVARFAEIAARGGASADYRVEFRTSPLVGANAFALPGGIILMTDELVALAQNDDEVLGVLAHELGHVVHRHSMRRILESSLIAMIIAGVTGDVSSMTSFASGAPIAVIHLAYSRDHEREADRYATELLRRSGIDPRHFAALLERMAAEASDLPGLPTFLSTHPSTTERTSGARGE